MRRYRLNLATGKLLLILAPAHLAVSVGERNHGDAIVHRTNQRAKIAADTLPFFYFRNWLARHAPGTIAATAGIYEGDRLMGAIFAGDVAKIAADALVIIDPGDALVVEIERFPFLDGWDRFAHKVHHALQTL